MATQKVVGIWLANIAQRGSPWLGSVKVLWKKGCTGEHLGQAKLELLQMGAGLEATEEPKLPERAGKRQRQPGSLLYADQLWKAQSTSYSSTDTHLVCESQQVG